MDFPAQVLTSYLRQGAVSTQLVPLFVTSSPGESSDTESAEEEEYHAVAKRDTQDC